MSILLSGIAPFARGGNRLCYVDPSNPQRVIKVQRPDFTLEDRRRKKGFPKNLRPLSSFDDNRQEFNEVAQLEQFFGDVMYRHVSRCYGFVETDMGAGLASELIRDASGKISHTLKQYLWDYGFDENSAQAVQRFAEDWIELAIPSRDLLLHNIVAQRDESGLIQRLVIIDGIGNPSIVPLRFWPRSARKQKAQRKIANLHERIQTLLGQRGQDKFPGYHGQLFHEGDLSAGASSEVKES
ncbi:Conserved hypothetical protein [gamma proteobacterium HdN1]|nr:Conserved hypothetical protein [gamma proteobacterium HdN1]